jgi:hypothetical protein
MMPEFEERMEEEQRQAEIDEQKQVQEINVQHAKKAIYVGYLVFAAGSILGFLLAHAVKLPWYIIPVMGYIVWSAYWGIIMVHRAVKSFYNNLFIFGTGIIDLIVRQIAMRLGMYLFTIPFVGLLFGALGGAFFKQIQYQKMINSSYEEQSRRQLLAFAPLMLLVLILFAAGYQASKSDIFEARHGEHAGKNTATIIPMTNNGAKNKISEKTLFHRNTAVVTPQVTMNASETAKYLQTGKTPKTGSVNGESDRKNRPVSGHSSNESNSKPGFGHTRSD